MKVIRIVTRKWAGGAVRRVMDAVPLRAYVAMVPTHVLSIVYHVVADERLPYIHNLYRYKTRAAFESDLIFLKRRFRFVHYDDLCRAIDGQYRLPHRSIILTFDDGYAECFSNVRPLLLKHDIPCIFFVTTDWIDNREAFYRNKISLCIERARSCDSTQWSHVSSRIESTIGRRFGTAELFCQWALSRRKGPEGEIDDVCELLGVSIRNLLRVHKPYLTVEQVKQLAADGFTVGVHTRSHRRVSSLDPRAAARDIIESASLIREWTGQAYAPFAFPYHADEGDVRVIEKVFCECDFVRLFFSVGCARRKGDLLINRVVMDVPGDDRRSNAGKLLRTAYKRTVSERGRRWLRGPSNNETPHS
jgi:hypothetical protein